METKEGALIPTDVMTDLEAILLGIGQGGLNDPELLRRIEERSRAIRERVLKERGIVAVAVDLVRETRAE